MHLVVKLCMILATLASICEVNHAKKRPRPTSSSGFRPSSSSSGSGSPPNQNQNWKKLHLLESECTLDTKLPNWKRNFLNRDLGIPTNLMSGMIGEKLTDFFAEVIRIANGLMVNWIVKITNWILHLWLDGLVEILFLLEENVLVNRPTCEQGLFWNDNELSCNQPHPISGIGAIVGIAIAISIMLCCCCGVCFLVKKSFFS